MRLSGAWVDSAYTTHDATTGGGLLDGARYARVRAVPLQDTNSPKTLLAVLAEAKASGAPFTSVVGVRPTGWTHTNAPKGRGKAAQGGMNRGGHASLEGLGGTTGADGGPAVVTPAAGGAREGGKADESRRSRDGFTGGADKGGDVESPWGDDQDDEAAAWGAGGDVGGGDEEEAGQEGGPWTGKKPWVEGNARVYSLPYSEHSSYTQLKDFVRTVRPK